jgi:hypothetical protein
MAAPGTVAMGNRYAAGVLGLAVNDATAGLRLFGRRLAVDYAKGQHRRYGFQVEMTHRLVQRGKIVEFPITFRNHGRGVGKLERIITRPSSSGRLGCKICAALSTPSPQRLTRWRPCRCRPGSSCTSIWMPSCVRHDARRPECAASRHVVGPDRGVCGGVVRGPAVRRPLALPSAVARRRCLQAVFLPVTTLHSEVSTQVHAISSGTRLSSNCSHSTRPSHVSGGAHCSATAR